MSKKNKLNLTDGFPTSVQVQFHEVDAMKIVHHSHYIYWMEIARFQFAKAMMGLSFTDFEKLGVFLPVTKLESNYLQSATLDQEIVIFLKLLERDVAIATFHYDMRDKNSGQKLFEGMTEHAFVDRLDKLLLHYPEKWNEALQLIKQTNPSYIL
ncbi:hypothetical protein BLX87_21895 [Bacillus sp. VT-16-64]|nr:hypothetical protein BLX87_21895 [Bacillus sp. VT-16-64]